LLIESLGQFTPLTFLFVILGVVLGIVVGAVPGLTATMLIALSLPLTFTMEPTDAISMLVAMYVGGISGSYIAAILLRIPGTPAAVITTLDGYPMKEQGQAGRALSLALWASFAGGIVSWFFLVLLSRPLSLLAVRFSEFDFFSMIVMALALIVILSKGDMIKGVVAGLLGIMVSFPGVDPIDGNYRFTFGIDDLRNGFSLLPVLVGLFAGNQILKEVLKSGSPHQGDQLSSTPALDKMTLRLRDLKAHVVNAVRSSLIGTWIGILPGVGASIGSAFAYSVAKTTSSKPEKFGNGSEEGVVASEAANNATVGGALVPLIALGIPGSVVDTILLGGFIIHGIQPGPNLFKDSPEFVNAIFVTYILANFLMLGIMFYSTRILVKIISIPSKRILPALAILCVLGSYSVSNSWYTVVVMLGFTFVGFMLERYKYPLSPFVIGLVLAPIAEKSFRASLMYTAGEITPLVLQPVPIICIVLTAAMGYMMFRSNKND
jgi:putative tricarboxylic transport membrane protein